ncbi:hypothetical protein H8D30_06645 [bacterium]|nr:hypothetical protein [bacterium]
MTFPYGVVSPLTSEGVGIWVAAILTLAIFSFLWKDNPFYRFAEHLFVGVSSGYFLSVYWWTVLKPNLYEPLVNGFEALGARDVSGAFGFVENPNGGLMVGEEPQLRVLVPLALGLFILLIFVAPKYAWLSKISFAWYIGVASGFAIPTALATRVLLQMEGAYSDFCGLNATCAAATGIDPISATSGFWINAVVMLVGTLCALAYFFFSLPTKGALRVMNRVGIGFLMVSFGASFGYTVMARISLLIGRFQFLIREWLEIA